MGLVDYSESESDSEPRPSKPAPKKPAFQKVVDRSNPGKIIVNLAQTPTDEPPTKRAKTSATSSGSSLFSGFNSFLPPPKHANPAPAIPTSSSQPRPRPPGIHLKTSAEIGFTRDDAGPTPSISHELKPAGDVKLVGKPLMFKPLSVARKPAKPKHTPRQPAEQQKQQAEPPPPKPTSLFSLHVEQQPSRHEASESYEPLFESVGAAEAMGPGDPVPLPTQPITDSNRESLHSVADDLNLSAAARRELFGRQGGRGRTADKVINFNMDQEYRHNEELRAAGEQQLHNPIRSIQGGGKHSLRQLVHNVVNQRDALEDSFAQGKTNRKEASSKYGW